MSRLMFGVLALIAFALMSGCSNELPGELEGTDAADNPLINLEGKANYDAMCASCHGSDGNGTSIGSSLVGCASCSSLSVLTAEIEATMPLNNAESCVEQCASDTAEYILYAFNSTSSSAEQTILESSALESRQITLRRASLQLASRLPTETELSAVDAEGDLALSEILDALMNEEAFYQRLMEAFNEQFLTDKYLSVNLTKGGINLLDPDDYPNREWYDEAYPSDTKNTMRKCIRNVTNDAVARAPLELIRYTSQNDLPHTLFLTADFMMVNWYSQQVYEAELVDDSEDFKQLSEAVCDADGEQVYYDPTDFRPARVTHDLEYEMGGIPHAGVLTSPMFLNRYPTTRTNRNRHRSRIVYDYLLDTDILAIEGERPEDGIGSGVDNPTLLDPACYSCHQVLDPVASAFQHWTDRGRYIVTGSDSVNSWDSSDIESPGINGKQIPLSGSDGQFRTMLQWLGREISEDPRFIRATVRTLYQGILGEQILATPEADASEDEKLAFNSQRAIINSIGNSMVAHNWNLKTAVKALVMSPYYRASSVDDTVLVENEHIGTSRFLSPEELQRKLQVTIGFGWDEFRREDNRLMFGGMDSDSIIERFKEPNGLIVAMQDRLATEMACRAAAYNFNLPNTQRRLFPDIEHFTLPITEGNIEAIRQTITHLHWTLLGEQLDISSSEVSTTYDLYISLLETGQTLILNRDDYDPKPSTYLEWECRARWEREQDGTKGEELSEEDRLETDETYNIRAWVGVLTYLMSDYRFIYE